LTLIVEELVKKHDSDLDRETLVRVRGYLSRIVVPHNITKRVVEKYIRKAFQIRAWYRLPHIDRLILFLARRFPRIKSPRFKEILTDIFLEIELQTIRGKALFYGILMAMKISIYKLGELLHNVKRILTIGLQYLNNPIIYRIYG
jgi:hypothetical protein